MRNTKSVHIEIFDFYYAHFHTEQERASARKYIREHLIKEFPEYNWSDTSNWYKLPPVDRNRFKLVTVRDYFTARSQLTPKQISRKVDEEIKAQLLEAGLEIQKHNERAEILKKAFYDEDASDEENRRLYDEFCSLLPEFTVSVKTPSWEEWPHRAHRLYDYQQSEMWESIGESAAASENSAGPATVTQEEIDHVALRALIKYMGDKFGFTMDYDDIAFCLAQRKSSDIDESSPVNDTLENREYYAAKNRLRNLEFVREG